MYEVVIKRRANNRIYLRTFSENIYCNKNSRGPYRNQGTRAFRLTESAKVAMQTFSLVNVV